MAYVITESCIDQMDQSCVAADPKLDRKFYVDPDGCIDCGSCQAACPNTAIVRADELSEDRAIFARIDASWYGDRAAARSAVDRLAPVA